MFKISNKWFLFFGLFLSLLSFYLINRQEFVKRKDVLEKSSLAVKSKIDAELIKVNLIIESLSFFIQNTPEIDQTLFEDFTNPFLKESNGVKALEWAPLIIDSDRGEYESNQVFLNDKKFNITQKNVSGSLIPAKTKLQYYPVHFINPIVTNEKALGYDLSSNDLRGESIKSSFQSGSISFTEPINLVQESSTSFGILAMKHIPKSEYNPPGVVLGVYSMPLFMNNILDYELHNIDIIVSDRLNKRTNLFTSAINFEIYKNSTPINSFEIVAADRKWEVNCYDKNFLLRYPHTLGSYLVFLLGVLLTFSLWSMINKKEDNKVQLERKIKIRTVELIDLNNQKDTLLKEIHHRVKNNMQAIKSLIGLQARYIKDEEVRELFKNTKNRINSMAMVHEMLYQTEDVSKINGKTYIFNLINQLINSYKAYNNEVKFEVLMDDVKLNIDTLIPLGLIITEIITNTLKYGSNHKSIIVINVALKISYDSQYLMIISDDGPGFELPKTENINSLGLRLIFRLISQLNGQIKKDDNFKGTKYEVKFQEINT